MLVLVLASVALYLPTVGGDFVYDARETVLWNDYAHHLNHLRDVVTPRVISLDVMDNNRPVHLALVIINWALWGANPAGHHLCNILFHALAVALLFMFCRRLLPESSALRPRGAWQGRARVDVRNGPQDVWGTGGHSDSSCEAARLARGYRTETRRCHRLPSWCQSFASGADL